MSIPGPTLLDRLAPPTSLAQVTALVEEPQPTTTPRTTRNLPISPPVPFMRPNNLSPHSELGRLVTDKLNQLYVPYFDQLDVYIEAIGKAETGGQDTGLVRGESKCKPYNTPPLNGDEGSNDKETLRLPQQKKIDKSKLAFEVDIDTTNFQEPVKSYLSQLENFSRDPKEALQLLKASGGAPIFPEESWPKILSGSFIDFNKHVFREGVWHTTSTAMEYAFNDQRAELDSYLRYISDFFLQFKPDFHVNIINLNVAIR
ncbi:hypothetical protein PQX77_014526, partial [Marasmius sp. AFHP31]